MDDDASSAPAYPALIEPQTLLRVERRLFHLNGALMVVFVLALRIWQLGAVNILLHFAAMWVTATHPDIVAVYLRYRLQGDFYRPWVSPAGWVRNRRPEGFGRL